MLTFDSLPKTQPKETMNKSRNKRVRPPGRHIITKELLELLQLLARYKYLRTNHIIGLLPHRYPDGLRRSLRRAFDNGYVLRPKERLRGYNSINCCEIYALDEKGEKLLAERDLAPAQATRLHRSKSDAPVKQFAHAMMICDTTASIEIGAKAAGVTFVPWTDIVDGLEADKPLKLPAHVSHTFGSTREAFDTFIVPDGLFGLRYPDGRTAYFALEAEHFNPIKPTTLRRASTLKKLIAYRDIVAKQVYKQQLGIGNLRVLVVAPTTARTTHQVELLEELVGKSHLFLFHPVPVQEELLHSPPPFPELFTADWARAGLPREKISEPTAKNPRSLQP
jgi:hypothetical protein